MTGNPFLRPYYRGQPLKRSQHFTHLLGDTPTGTVCEAGKVNVTAENVADLIESKSTDFYKGVKMIINNASVPGMIVGTIHGYRRNKGDIILTIGWGLLGMIFPFMTTGIAVAQGFTISSEG